MAYEVGEGLFSLLAIALYSLEFLYLWPVGRLHGDASLFFQCVSPSPRPDSFALSDLHAACTWLFLSLRLNREVHAAEGREEITVWNVV